jgi:23S rRNA pseudouridine955/2504/2580 synthase
MSSSNELNSSIKYLKVEQDYLGQRLDNFLLKRLKGLPKSRLYRALRQGEIRINKKRVKADYRLQLNDEIRIPPLRLAVQTVRVPKAVQLELIKQTIIYEDKGLIIINKPSGIAAHGGSGINFGVIELFRHLRPQLKFLELVHRLDRETTGCLVLAKKSSILKELHSLLVEGKVEKTYLALANGICQGQSQKVNAPLLKKQSSSGERIVIVHQAGKAAETVFKPLQNFKQATLLQARPLTGRTHQIRVHAAHIGHAIIGDEKYGSHIDNKIMREQGAKHLLLHAAALRFTLPSTGQAIAICACLDEVFLSTLKKLRN